MKQTCTIFLLFFGLTIFGQEEDICEWEFWQNIDTSDLENLEIIKGSSINCKNLPNKFYTLLNLRVVIIDPAGLQEISPTIQNLTKLEKLAITKSKLTSLPKEIGKLESLKVLSISWGGELQSIPSEIGNLRKLEVLDLSKNKLSSLPSSIGNLENLKLLRLSKNNLTAEEQARIRKMLPNCEIIFDF